MYRGERFNSLTHLVGFGLAVIGLIYLMQTAVTTGNSWKIISFSIFGVSLVTLYLSSTLYHSLQGPAKARWATADHCSIYVLIAGTYTPFTLVTLHGPTGWTLFGIIWGLAGWGIRKELLKRDSSAPSLLLYLCMGWSGLTVLSSLIQHLPNTGLYSLLAGGLFYTTGVLFYLKDEAWRHAHGIWHLFVLAGSTCHYMTIMYFV